MAVTEYVFIFLNFLLTVSYDWGGDDGLQGGQCKSGTKRRD